MVHPQAACMLTVGHSYTISYGIPHLTYSRQLRMTLYMHAYASLIMRRTRRDNNYMYLFQLHQSFHARRLFAPFHLADGLQSKTHKPICVPVPHNNTR